MSDSEGEYDVAEETFLGVFEGSLFHRSPVPNPFPSQGGEWGGDGGELREELMVKTTEPEK